MMRSGMTSVREVSSRADLRRFIKYPFAKYRKDLHWVPPLLISERANLDPKKNPFYEHARVELFLAERDGEVVGRVAGIDDDNHNRTHGDNLVFFGFFEAKDAEAAQALFERVEGWARGLGRAAVRGPANPSLNHSAGLQVDAFDTDPYVMMPYNPPEYPRYVEAAGYRKVKDLYAWLFEGDQALGERAARLVERVRRRHDPVIRFLDMKRFDEELELAKKIYNHAWEKNWGFVRYTDAEFDHLVREFKPILDPDLAAFVELDGQTAGLAIVLPDVNQVLKRMRGRLLPFGIFHFLNRNRIIDRARLPIMGTLPEYRNRGINHVIEAYGAKRYKTYRLYQKEI